MASPAPSHLVIQQPLPLTMARIKWRLAPRPALPIILQRIDFNGNFFNVQGSRTQGTPLISGGLLSPSSTPSLTPPPSSPPSPRSGKIPKPNGEPGRPKSGGFSLEAVLTGLYNWTDDDVARLNRLVRQHARKTLSIRVSYRNQNEQLITRICEKITEDAFPQLDDYENCWPVHSALKLALKYFSESTRRATRAHPSDNESA